jgi:hypothetical protein
MRIDKRLNLVIEIEDGKRKSYVHSTPLSREVFEANFLLISKTFTAIYAEGLSTIAGPRIASLMLREIASRMDGDVPPGQKGENATRAEILMAEIRRLTVIIAPGEKGWEPEPFEGAVARGVINEEDNAEVENALVFFTCGSAMHRRAELEPMLKSAVNLWGGQITSSTSTEWIASLPKSSGIANTGAKPAGLSVTL